MLKSSPSLQATEPLFPPDMDVGALIDRLRETAARAPLPTPAERLAELRDYWSKHHRQLTFPQYLMVRCGWRRWSESLNDEVRPDVPDDDEVQRWFIDLDEAEIMEMVDLQDGARGRTMAVEAKLRRSGNKTVRPWQRFGEERP